MILIHIGIRIVERIRLNIVRDRLSDILRYFLFHSNFTVLSCTLVGIYLPVLLDSLGTQGAFF